MAGTFLGKYDTTAANNAATGTNSVSVAEGMLPSNINNAFRDIMADIRQHYNTAEWIEYGDGELYLVHLFQQILQLILLGIQDLYLVKLLQVYTLVYYLKQIIQYPLVL
jgi:hypothetical protein